MNACPHKYGCCGNYLLAWNVAQMSVIPSLFASYSPRSVHASFCGRHDRFYRCDCQRTLVKISESLRKMKVCLSNVPFFLLPSGYTQPLGQQNVNESLYFISPFFGLVVNIYCLQIVSFLNNFIVYEFITALLFSVFCTTYFGNAAFCSVIFQPCKVSHNLYCRYSSCVLMYIGAVLSSCCCSLEQHLNTF